MHALLKNSALDQKLTVVRAPRRPSALRSAPTVRFWPAPAIGRILPCSPPATQQQFVSRWQVCEWMRASTLRRHAHESRPSSSAARTRLIIAAARRRRLAVHERPVPRADFPVLDLSVNQVVVDEYRTVLQVQDFQGPAPVIAPLLRERPARPIAGTSRPRVKVHEPRSVRINDFDQLAATLTSHNRHATRQGLKTIRPGSSRKPHRPRPQRTSSKAASISSTFIVA